MAQQIDLPAQQRTITGKKVSQLRRTGIIPAVVYGHHKAATNIQVDERALHQTLMRAGMNRLINIQLGAEGVMALVRDIQREPISQRVVHVDFLAVAMDEPITANVPIHLEGVAPALDQGGTLLQALAEIEIRALPADLIAGVTVDVSKLADYDAVIHVRDIQVPERVEVLTDGDELVAKVAPPAVEEEEVAAEEAPATPEVITETETQRRRTERDD
ncbi:MAG: 50S ribosomal protein L25 [Anaerolineae bacterium]|nr:50S ribosomal protein L25 [Anaerolineae bacterium]